jgi:hypothetical protein
MRDRIRDDHMLVEVEPPLIGQDHGQGALNISQLVLSSRYQGDTLYPIGQWPCHVYIARILDESISETLYFTKEQVEIIAWGMIFRTIEDAKACNKNLKRNGT